MNKNKKEMDFFEFLQVYGDWVCAAFAVLFVLVISSVDSTTAGVLYHIWFYAVLLTTGLGALVILSK